MLNSLISKALAATAFIDERPSANGGGRSEGQSPRAAGYIRGRAPDRMEKACEAGLSCGQVVLYRTFLEDLEELYLSGF